ncbi:MAG: gamma-tocopherol methyltransferase [Fibrobacteres bacterium]|nr:gamma-tocopherol methyltransferase [Fibrobacterota bacterium]
METGPARDALATAPATAAADLAAVNNAFYDSLGDRWYDAYDDPVALLRAEGELKNPWVAQRIRSHLDGRPGRILDIGCGAGFLANALAAEGHRVSGIDMSRGSLRIARSRSKLPAYRVADAYRLPYRDGTFDSVTALDFLEHVTAPDRVIAEAARVLRPGGLFFFHTFNRNPLAWLIVIKGLEWFVRNTPERMHVLPLFIKPKELETYCRRSGMAPAEMTGMRPVIGSAFWKMLATRRVPGDFRFRFTPSLGISYLGYAKKT